MRRLQCPALRCVKLDDNHLKGHCMEAVAAMVQAAACLEYLSLSQNPQVCDKKAAARRGCFFITLRYLCLYTHRSSPTIDPPSSH